MTLANKIEYIYKTLACNNKEISGKQFVNIWNIDTNVFNTWERFIDIVVSNKIRSNKLMISKVIGKKDYFILEIDGINVNPRKQSSEPSKFKEDWSKGAVRQFLQEATALGFIHWDSNTFEGTHILDDDFYNLIDGYKTWADIIMNAIIKGCFSHCNYINWFSASILYCMICDGHIDAFNKFDDEIIFSSIRGSGDNPLKLFTNKEEELILRKYESIKDAKSWNGLVDKLLEQYTFDQILDKIYFKVAFDYAKDERLDKFVQLDKETEQFKRDIENARSGLREAIIQLRANSLKKYSDIVLEKEPYMDYVDAAHIYEIHQIKKDGSRTKSEIDKYLRQYLVSDAKNANNGLLLPIAVHRAFDHGLFKFNIADGTINYDEDDRDEIDSLGILNTRIKAEVLNDEMRDYLRKRTL